MNSKAVFVLAALVALVAMPATAALKVDIGGTIIEDNDGVFDQNPNVGRISYDVSGTGVNFDLNFGTSRTFDPFGTITISNTGTALAYPATIEIKVTDTDFTLPPGPDGSFLRLALGAINPGGEGAVGSIESTGYYDPNNNEFATAGPGVVSTSTASVTTNSDLEDEATSGGIVPFVTPFSLTQVLSITLTGPGSSTDPETANSFQVQSNLTVVAVPEPTTVALFGTLLGFTGLTLRKRFAK